MTIAQLLSQLSEQLKAVSATPTLEAEILLAHILMQPRSYLRAWPETVLEDAQINELMAMVNRRLQNEPIAYITGQKEFWSLDLAVTRDTLIPRPETELVVETALNIAANLSHEIAIADLGTGSGAIALALAHERPQWQIYACDISESALAVAKLNAARLTLNHISFHQGHWCKSLPRNDLHLIIANPPYIAETEWAAYAAALHYEPKTALVSGQDGLNALTEIIATAKTYLRKGGSLIVEHGYAQGQAVRQLFQKNGYQEIQSILDLADKERITLGSFY